MEKKQRLNHIEFIRAIAALSVAAFHFTNHNNGERYLIHNESVRSFFTYGAQGVELFYVISGFIISYSLSKGRYKIKHYFHYLTKRLSRLFPPYFATIILITLVSFCLTTITWGGEYNVEWRKILANAFFAVDFISAFDWLKVYFPDNGWINPIFETLKVELQFYLLIGLLFPLINKNKWYFIGFAILLLTLGIYSPSMNTVLINSPYFIIGIAAFYIFEKGWKLEFITVIAISFISLYQFYAFQDLIAAAVAVTLILVLPSNFKLFGITGKISYSYYLIHGLIGGWFLFFSYDTYLGLNYPYILIVIALLLSWLGAFTLYYCIEKPSLLISKRIKYKD